MDLKDYIAGALSAIAEGVQQAQAQVRKTGGIVNPAGLNYRLAHEKDMIKYGDRVAAKVDFDIQVGREQSEQSKAGLRVILANIFTAGVEGQSSEANTSGNRLRFSVPLVLPNDCAD